MTSTQSAAESMAGLAQGDAVVLETLTQMSVRTLERSGLDEQTYMLVWMAALVTSDAAPVSYLASLGAAPRRGCHSRQGPGDHGCGRTRRGSAFRSTSAASKLTRAGASSGSSLASRQTKPGNVAGV